MGKCIYIPAPLLHTPPPYPRQLPLPVFPTWMPPRTGNEEMYLLPPKEGRKKLKVDFYSDSPGPVSGGCGQTASEPYWSLRGSQAGHREALGHLFSVAG